MDADGYIGIGRDWTSAGMARYRPKLEFAQSNKPFLKALQFFFKMYIAGLAFTKKSINRTNKKNKLSTKGSWQLIGFGKHAIFSVLCLWMVECDIELLILKCARAELLLMTTAVLGRKSVLLLEDVYGPMRAIVHQAKDGKVSL